MNPFISLLKVIQIEITRFSDHIRRRLTGAPYFPNSEVTPQLFVGGQYADRGFPTMKDKGITAIVNMRTTAIPKRYQVPWIKHLHLPTIDWTAPSLTDLQKGVKFIDKEVKKEGKVYIHCRMGEGRGPTMAIAYLISTGLTYDDAFAQVKRVRSFIRPSRSQVEQLKRFEQLLSDSKKKNSLIEHI